MKIRVNYFAGIRDFKKSKFIEFNFPGRDSLKIDELIPKLNEYYGNQLHKDFREQRIFFSVNNELKKPGQEIQLFDGDRCAFFNSIAGG